MEGSAMQELDLSKMFDSMSSNINNGGNPIQSIYDIIPTYDSEQQRLLFQVQFFINKWGLTSLEGMLNAFTEIMARNKNLSFFGSKNLQNMLSAYTQADLIRGINVRANQESKVD